MITLQNGQCRYTLQEYNYVGNGVPDIILSSVDPLVMDLLTATGMSCPIACSKVFNKVQLSVLDLEIRDIASYAPLEYSDKSMIHLNTT